MVGRMSAPGPSVTEGVCPVNQNFVAVTRPRGRLQVGVGSNLSVGKPIDGGAFKMGLLPKGMAFGKKGNHWEMVSKKQGVGGIL